MVGHGLTSAFLGGCILDKLRIMDGIGAVIIWMIETTNDITR
jgi:hypothetical protein